MGSTIIKVVMSFRSYLTGFQQCAEELIVWIIHLIATKDGFQTLSFPYAEMLEDGVQHII